MSARSTDTIHASPDPHPDPNQGPPSSAPVFRGSSRASDQQRETTGRVRQPASLHESADVRQPALRERTSARRPRRADGAARDDGQAEGAEVQAREQARAEARRRAQARVRPVDSANVRDAGSQQRAARGMHMDRLSLPLRELHERHARLARTLNKSEKTITWYRGSLEDFCRFLEGPLQAPGKEPASPTLRDFTLERVRDYILYVRGRPAFGGHPFKKSDRTLSDHSVNCYVRGLRAFASWLYEQEYTDTNILGRLKAPKVTKKAVEILTDEEIAHVLEHLRTPSATNVRNRAIFLTLLDTGIRASELLTLTIPRAHLDEGYLLVLGKGKKERPVKIGQTAAEAMRHYLTRYRPEPARSGIQEVFLSEGYRVRRRSSSGNGDEGSGGNDQLSGEELLFTEPGWPLSKTALDYIFLRIARRTGVERLHPHLLRHTYACRYLLAHRDPIALKTMLGHTTLAMTNHYVQAVEGMQVIRSDRVSVVDAMELNVGRLKRGNPRGRRRPST